MTDVLGSGDYRYEPVPGWGQLPEGWSLKEVGAVAVDSQDRVYIFTYAACRSSDGSTKGDETEG